MKKLLRHIPIICVALLFATCTTDNSDITNSLMSVEYSSMPIAFSTDDNVSTRGNLVTSADLSSFIVNARYYKYTGGAPFDFFQNQEVSKSAGLWTYTPVKYWPAEGEMDFFAYSPTDIKGTFESLTFNHDRYPDWLLRYQLKDPVITTINELSGTVIPQSTYDKAIDAQNQQDLLLAIAPQQQCSKMTVDGHVKMDFVHALAGLDFKFSNDYNLPTNTTHVILSIAPLCAGGTITMNSSSAPEETRWALNESEATYYQGYALDGDKQLVTEGKTFFLPPQSLKNFAVTARFYQKEDGNYTLLDTRTSMNNNIELERGVTQTLTLRNQ